MKMTKDYINKTRQAVNFLSHVYHDKTEIIAVIQLLQAEGRTDDLINVLFVVRDFAQELINELKKIRR